ncbi:MAG: TPM domain-containing protein [Fibrobacteria bacterium]
MEFNRFNRIARHFWIGRPEVRKLFPEASLERITQAIAAGEAGHHGEIRFAVEASLDWGRLRQGVTARERAVEVFSQLRVWDTEANNGVLIYLLLADRDVEIIADRGVHAKVGAHGWEEICKKMEAEFRQGRFEAGLLPGISSVSGHLLEHFPRRGPDTNELPDRPILL